MRYAIKNNTSQIRRLCGNHINVIFDNILEQRLIDAESSFYKATKGHAFNACFEHIYPLMELSDPSMKESDFFLYSSYLLLYILFLDECLDCSRISSRQVRAFQISSYLLLQYFDWLKAHYPSKTVHSFYHHYTAQTNYLTMEKKWNWPQLYTSSYATEDNIYQKEILLLFPLELYAQGAGSAYGSSLKYIITNYYSYILLTDDLLDIDLDIQNRCLTYPIALYYKLKGELPSSHEDIWAIRSQVIGVLNTFTDKIDKTMTELGRESFIISDKLHRIKTELKTSGWVA